MESCMEIPQNCESLCSIPETYIILYINYTSVFKNKIIAKKEEGGKNNA